MATLKVNTLSGIGTEGPVLNGGLKFRSENYMTLPKGDTTQRGRGRGVIGGGDSQNTRVGFIDIQSQGNANEFGQLTFGRLGSSACASSTRILFCGGYDAPSNTNIIDFFTIAITSNATDFGDLSVARTYARGLASKTRGFGCGGYAPNSDNASNVIDFITIATTGNSQDFGDLRGGTNRAHSRVISPVSDSHGGLGGY